MNQQSLEARQNAGPRVFLNQQAWRSSRSGQSAGLTPWALRQGPSSREVEGWKIEGWKIEGWKMVDRYSQAETFSREAPAAGRPSAP